MSSYKSSRYSSSSSDIGCFGVIMIIILAIMCLFPIVKSFSTYTYTGTIIEKGYSGNHEKYVIWVEDESGTQHEFSNADQFWKGKFNSGTIQGKLKEGSTYEFTVSGWRIPLFSEYPNIVDYRLIESGE